MYLKYDDRTVERNKIFNKKYEEKLKIYKNYIELHKKKKILITF